MEFDHQLHILSHGGGIVAPRVDDRTLFEQAKGAGNDDAAVEPVKQDPGRQEGAIILQHLHTGQDLPGHPVGNDPPVLNLSAVAGADSAAHRHHVPIFDDRPHDLLQGVVLQHRVGVHAHKVGVSGGVDPHVQCVGFAAVFLADQRDRHFIGPGLKNSQFRLAGNHTMDGAGNLLHPEGLPEDPGGIVPGAIVHNNDLIQPVFQVQQRADGGDDGDLLIVGGHQDSHGHIVILKQFVLQEVAPLELVQGGGAHRHGQKEKTGIPHHIENKKYSHKVIKYFDCVHRHGRSAPTFCIRRDSSR